MNAAVWLHVRADVGQLGAQGGRVADGELVRVLGLEVAVAAIRKARQAGP